VSEESDTSRQGESLAGQPVAEQGAGTGFVVTVDEVIAVNDHARVRGEDPRRCLRRPSPSRQQESLLWAGCHRGWRLVPMTGITCAFILGRRPRAEEDVPGW
jgi:hypothetical protein